MKAPAKSTSLPIEPPYNPMEARTIDEIPTGRARSSGLIAPEMLVEIEADAYISNSTDGA